MSIMPLSALNATSNHGGMTRKRDTLSIRLRRPSAIHIVENPRDPKQLVVRRVRHCDRLIAHVFASSLDDQLAAGRSPESGRLLATRAQQLASVTMRRELARDFDHLLDVVNRAANVRGPRVLVSRELIAEVEPDLRHMLAMLTTPLAAPARGVAMVRTMLTDGTGPLFNPRCSTSLRDAIQDAQSQLDPAGVRRRGQSLVPPELPSTR
jgi:hypothetical protein